MKISACFPVAIATLFLLSLNGLAQAEKTKSPIPAKPSSQVRIAAVQISGYDKGDLPRDGYDVVSTLLPYIDRAHEDRAELVVFPEYVLGHISVPGPETEALSAAAARNGIYVIVGAGKS